MLAVQAEQVDEEVSETEKEGSEKILGHTHFMVGDIDIATTMVSTCAFLLVCFR